NLSDKAAPYDLSTALTLAQLNCELGSDDVLGDSKRKEKGKHQLLALIDKYGKNVAYATSIYYSFDYPTMTYENAVIPGQYYRFIDLYEKYGGDRKNVEPILKKHGLNEQELKAAYEKYLRKNGIQTSSADQQDAVSWEDFEKEIAKYCEVANELASLSPEEYSKRSADEKSIDSVVYSVIEYYLENGGTEENLQKYEQYQKLDKKRAKQLSDMNQGL
ncbi:MAG: hypothetical protein K2G13_00225, partial [Muribaculaceae bacterium]|nr:hypothetical protein [Muribaculaceae bacterium]